MDDVAALLGEETPKRLPERFGLRRARLEERYGANVFAMAVAKGQPGWLACVSGFIEEARSSGLVQRAVASAGLCGVKIVPG